jgi:hypothetical protein
MSALTGILNRVRDRDNRLKVNNSQWIWTSRVN